ncbi:uncharacterized protein LOC126686278 [Mercurialis annua]|uniref:uncharacterized protein LOC126686278 n=1 Tax=Mercurialis annua TaxID=3986 RepID=UPI002160B966|nr:uncharacterized protein LOC126686278 [Mercurialis annua]
METTSELVSLSHPWLLIRYSKDETNIKEGNILFNVSDNKYYKDIIPDVQDKVVCTSFGGWFMLKDDNESKDYCLLNPISAKRLELPSLECGGDIYYILSSSPLNSNCYVLCISNWEKAIWFCQPGDEKFTKQETFNSLYSPTMFQGKLYCATGRYQLVAIDFKGLELEFTTISTEHDHFDIYGNTLFSRMLNQNYLIEFHGELLYVSKVYYGFYNGDVATFIVSKFDLSRNRWMKMDTIGNWAIFLSLEKGTCCIAEEKAGVKKNSIYFLDKQDDGCLYIYDIEDDSVSMSLCCGDIHESDIMGFEWIRFVDQ